MGLWQFSKICHSPTFKSYSEGSLYCLHRGLVMKRIFAGIHIRVGTITGSPCALAHNGDKRETMHYSDVHYNDVEDQP